eukprot:4369208-Amphidinium_carterae.2
MQRHIGTAAKPQPLRTWRAVQHVTGWAHWTRVNTTLTSPGPIALCKKASIAAKCVYILTHTHTLTAASSR